MGRVKYFHIILPVSLSLVLLWVLSCQKEPNIIILVDEVEIPYSGGETTITINPNVSWTAKVAYSSKSGDWIELPCDSGEAGEQEFVIRVKDNPSTLRKARVVFTLTEPDQISDIDVFQYGLIDRDMTDSLGLALAAYWMSNNRSWGRINYRDIQNCKGFIFDAIDSDFSFEGLSLFKNLDQILVKNSKLDRLSFSEVPWLNKLYIHSCEIGELDLSCNPDLVLLSLQDISLKELDTSNNPCLSSVSFDTAHGPLPDLERVVLGPGVESFYITNAHQLTEIDCSGANRLSFLYFRNADVHRLDLSNTIIKYLEISQNPIDYLMLPKTLERLSIWSCSGNISSLKVGPGMKELSVFGTTIETMDLSEAVGVDYIYLDNNLLKDLDISHFSLPPYLRFMGNPGEFGVFKLIVSARDYEAAKELYEGLSWDYEHKQNIVTHVIIGN